jgi:hypothetical protein
MEIDVLNSRNGHSVSGESLIVFMYLGRNKWCISTSVTVKQRTRLASQKDKILLAHLSAAIWNGSLAYLR